MRFLAGAVVIAALALGCASSPPEADDAVTVAVESDGLCTGTVIRSSGLVLTAGHCVTPKWYKNAKITVRFQNGKTDKATVVLDDDKTDIAILQLDTARDLVYATLRCDEPARKGETIHTVGMPAGLGWIRTHGYVAGFYGRYVLVDMRVWHGNSGGAVFDVDGRIIAVVSNYFYDTQNKIRHIVAGGTVPVSVVCKHLGR